MGEVLAARVRGVEIAHASLPFVDYSPRPWPFQPFRGAGTSLVNAAVVKRDDALDEGEPVGALTKFTTGLPARLGYYIG